MNKIVWDQAGERIYETGVDHGVLYPMDQNGSYPKGIAWNGLTAVTESPSGAEANPLYADNIKYLNMMSAEEFGCTIEAFTYPDEFGLCDGSVQPTPGLSLGQQTRKQFGLSYRTLIGNDVEGNDLGHKIHLIFGAVAAPSERGYASINESPEAIALSWTVTTTPVEVAGYKPTAAITIDSTKVDPAKLAEFESILYGKAATVSPVAPAVEGRMPLPVEVISLLAAAGG